MNRLQELSFHTIFNLEDIGTFLSMVAGTFLSLERFRAYDTGKVVLYRYRYHPSSMCWRDWKQKTRKQEKVLKKNEKKRKGERAKAKLQAPRSFQAPDNTVDNPHPTQANKQQQLASSNNQTAHNESYNYVYERKRQTQYSTSNNLKWKAFNQKPKRQLDQSHP